MKDSEQARELIENTLRGLEKSVNENDGQAIQRSKQEFSTLIGEYTKVIGTKDIKNYAQNYTNIMKKGGYLK